MNREAEVDQILDDWFMKSKDQLKASLNSLIDRLVIEGRQSELEMFKKIEITGMSLPVAAHISRRYKLLSQSSQQGANLQDTTKLTADTNEADNRSEVA